MSERTRRRFLEESMFAAAAAVAAGSSGITLADEAKQSTSPGEKLSVAVVGVNSRGTAHISEFGKRKDCEITYIVDPDENVGKKRAEAIAKNQNGRAPTWVADMRKAYEDKSLDIVSIATPNHWHSLAAIWAMQAGKDVYVEKPVSHNVSEGRRAVETARKHKKICQTGTQSRSMVGMRAAMQYLHDGKLGNVTLGRGLCYKPRPSIGPKGVYEVPKGIDYDLWLGPAPQAQLTRKKFHYDWHMQFAYGNGDLGNQGIHQMDLCRWGLGLKTLSNHVTTYGGRLGYDDAGDAANTQIIVHDYGDKSLVFEVRGLPTGPYKGATVGVMFEGSEGFLVMASYSAGAAFDKEGKKIEEFKGGDDSAHFANFIGAVRSRKHEELNADIEEGHLSSALCHLGNISYRLGTPVSVGEAQERLKKVTSFDNSADTFNRLTSHLDENHLDLGKLQLQWGPTLNVDVAHEKFTDNSQADALLTRDYRAPFIVPPAGQV